MAENKTEAPVAEEVEAAVEETAAETPVEETAEKSEAEVLAENLAELNEKYLRLAAEYDNYRKRTAKEKEGIYANARIDTVTAFLGVHDNLERGIRQYEEGSTHRQGLEMIMKQFDTALESLGVTEIRAEGAEFDPNIHNAVMHVEDENLGENTVAEVFEKGFMLGDKVLRFATVKVAN
ncbi:MAG: nucleotide exchange factor GrpE [Oscillospiraceae bacterium]|nr:nucleotide exchange factor GrpE [Oscillospiraceae bacterium]